MPKNKKNGKSKKGGKGRGKNSRMVPNGMLMSGVMVLKPFHPTPVFRKLFRYKIGTLISGQTVTAANIFAMWVIAQSTTVGRAIMASMRVKHVTALATALSSTTSDELYIRDASSQGLIDPVDATSTGQGNAVVTWKPNKKSLAGDWFNFGTQLNGAAANLFILSVPSGGIIEIGVEFVLNGASGTTATTTYTLAGATTGLGYSMGPDGSAGSIYYSAIGMNNA